VEADYRTATGPVDKVVSIGMFEHVGDYYFANFFQFVESLLKPGGTAVVHTITSGDSEYPIYKLKGGFMQEFIFPGCCIPAVSAMINAMQKSRQELQHFENIGEHYALTLRNWRLNFYKNIKKVAKLKGNEAWPVSRPVAHHAQLITTTQLTADRPAS
jgi:cyclopropane-fatty-acyl-phospholipid synthase